MRRAMGRLLLAVVAASFALAAAAQDPPKVVSLDPPNGAEVDPTKVTRLVVRFDQPMMKDSQSFCGGAAFPKSDGKPKWEDDKTVVLDVELETGREYHIGINCPAAMNFRSKGGVSVEPTPWSFSTLPAKLRPAAEQKQRNQKALAALLKVLAENYSYRDLRVKDWAKLEKEHTPKVLAARTDRGFAAAAAEMLKPTQDLHLYLRLGEATFATGSRSVDPMFRRPLVEREVRVAPAGKQVLAGRTADGIGYLLVGAWTNDVDPEVVGGAITELADTKAMVIDVRPNSGGDERLAQQVAAWFVRGTHTYAKNRFRTGAGKDAFGPVLERQITGHGENRHYDRPIAVLTSRYVMSSNESFVKMLRCAPDCVVVGQPTFGSSGNPRPHELGNGVTVLVPSWQDMRADGTLLEGEGLAPDVVVECTAKDLETNDPILAKALALLRAKVRGDGKADAKAGK
jgi:hypothetical protein